MEETDQIDEWFARSFMPRLSTILKYGFAYLFAHPEVRPYIDSEMNKIRKYERIQSEMPSKREHCRKLIELTFIEYINKICQCAFLYMRHHPDTINEFRHIRRVFDAHEEFQQIFSRSHRRCHRSKKSKEDGTLKEIMKLLEKVQNAEQKMEEIKKNRSSRKEKSRSCELFETLRNIRHQVKSNLSENEVDIEKSQEHEEDSASVSIEINEENESDRSSILHFNDCVKSSTRTRATAGPSKSDALDSTSKSHQIECCEVIQPIVNRIETTLNSLSAQQGNESSGSGQETNPSKSITLKLESQQFSSILPEFKTTKLSNGHIQVELKLNLE